MSRVLDEFSPEEFGVTHPTLNAFIPIDYLGTRLISGIPVASNSCVKGFDNAGFVIGQSISFSSSRLKSAAKKNMRFLGQYS